MITATINAAPKLLKWKLDDPTSVEVNSKVIAFITNENSPNVINVIGKEIICNSGLTVQFKITKTKLAMIAVPKLSI